MSRILLLCFLLRGSDATTPQPGEIQLSITRDPYTSSDQVTLCRVRAINGGSRRFSGKAIRFEARATDGGEVVRERGRFGLVLEPHGSLETLIALPGRHSRFEVELLPPGKSSAASDSQRRRSSGHKARKPHPDSERPR